MKPDKPPNLVFTIRLSEPPVDDRAGRSRGTPRGRELIVEYHSETASLTGAFSGACLGMVRALLERDLRALTAASDASPSGDLLRIAAALEPVA